jgi:hypothetical protein
MQKIHANGEKNKIKLVPDWKHLQENLWSELNNRQLCLCHQRENATKMVHVPPYKTILVHKLFKTMYFLGVWGL